MKRLAVALSAGLVLAGCESAQFSDRPALRADLMVVGQARSKQEQTVMVRDVAELWNWIELELLTDPATRIGFFEGANCTIWESSQQPFLVILNWQSYGRGKRNAGYYEAPVCLAIDETTAKGIVQYAPRDALPGATKP